MKVRRQLLLLTLVVLVALVPLSVAYAQTYAFQVPTQRVDVYWETNGTLSVTYEITFRNESYADPIDYVDVGLPNSSYSISNISASIDGRPITHIAYSPYVDNGVELGLGANAIQPGQTGTVRMSATNVRNVLYEDNNDSSYASALFMPNYFDSDFVNGSSDITVVFHLPPGVQPSEPRWHTAGHPGFPDSPVTGVDNSGRITYTWRNTTASAGRDYLFGASFPARYVASGTVTTPTFWQRYGIDPDVVIGLLVCLCFAGVFTFIVVIAVRSERSRKLKYLPPKISVEGHGIKRGLTAPEAAILLEQPMDKILTMIMFSVVKKGAAEVVKRDPLDVARVTKQPTGLKEYENDFLNAFAESDKAKRRRELQQMMVRMVRGVANKMRGFSKRETVEFYKKITADAWKEVEAADTPQVKSEAFDENLEWTMLDPNYDRRTRDVFADGPVYLPRWYGGYNPAYNTAGKTASAPSVGRSSSSPTRSTGSPSLPTLPGGDFAASVVGGVQSFASSVVGNLSDFTGGVTKVTNPPPPPTASSGGGGFSGGGSSCACACAGCACACAGGGR
ncbi:MAG: hypothetical protein KF698_04230 [Anaerolineales bacterium]|nr:hypothetical protein [Anaerolineales bacterium]